MTSEVEWAPLLDIEGYDISTDGQVWSDKTFMFLKQQHTSDGHHYLMFRAGRKGKARKVYIHQAVLTVFFRPPFQWEETRHLDGDPHNNKLNNLVWGTRLENVSDKQVHGTQTFGETHPPAKLTESDVLEIRKRVGNETIRSLAKEYGVSHTAIRRAGNGTTWSHLR